MEKETFIKCTGCETINGVFINENQPMQIHCGICNEIKEFVVVENPETENE